MSKLKMKELKREVDSALDQLEPTHIDVPFLLYIHDGLNSFKELHPKAIQRAVVVINTLKKQGLIDLVVTY